MDYNSLVLHATVKLRCCGYRCEKTCEVTLNETIFPEDLEDDARIEAEIKHDWEHGLYCPECRIECRMF